MWDRHGVSGSEHDGQVSSCAAVSVSNDTKPFGRGATASFSALNTRCSIGVDTTKSSYARCRCARHSGFAVSSSGPADPCQTGTRPSAAGCAAAPRAAPSGRTARRAGQKTPPPRQAAHAVQDCHVCTLKRRSERTGWPPGRRSSRTATMSGAFRRRRASPPARGPRPRSVLSRENEKRIAPCAAV